MSPARGLLLFTPVLLLIPFGFRRAPLELAMLAWLFAHWLVISAFPHWWAGHCFGPRLWTEAMLGACWLLLPLFEKRLSPVLIVLSILSIAIHTRGATSVIPWKWNGVPDNVDEHPERLWDWRDLQFLRRDSAPAAAHLGEVQFRSGAREDDRLAVGLNHELRLRVAQYVAHGD